MAWPAWGSGGWCAGSRRRACRCRGSHQRACWSSAATMVDGRGRRGTGRGSPERRRAGRSVSGAPGRDLHRVASRLDRATSTVSREIRGQRWPGRVSAGGPLSGPGTGSAPERPKPGLPPAPRRPPWLEGLRRPRACASSSPRSDDAGEPRDHLPVPVRAGPRRAAPGLARCLRASRKQRRPRPDPGPDARHGEHLRPPRRGRRPGRARPLGRRLILGEGRSAVGTLVERTTRSCCCCTCPTAGRASMSDAQGDRHLPDELVRSITWDQGAEMARPRRFTIDTGIPSTSATPTPVATRLEREHQRPLRQYLPKGTDLTASAEDLARSPAASTAVPARPSDT